jgi:hypothetical protein
MNQPENSQLSRSSEGLHYTASALTFRITALTGHNLDRLRVTLKASTPQSIGTFHIDNLDLYNSRAREIFSESCAKHLKVKQSVALADLSELITVLEKERIDMRARRNKPEIPPMTDKEKAEALEALKSKDLLKRIVLDFEAIGFIGEKHNKLLGYIAAVSRLLPDPLALLILSRPGAGKQAFRTLYASSFRRRALSSTPG